MAKFITVPDLGRSKPATCSATVTAAEHLKQFFPVFQRLDVWDAEGWLITAVCEESSKGIFTHARKGTQARQDYMPATEILYFNK